MTLKISWKYLENTQISNLMKICPMGDELFHANGWTHKLTVALSNFANMPKYYISLEKFSLK
jgi:hypothetical protein